MAAATAVDVKLRPLYDRIVVRRKEAQEKTASGLYIPDTTKEKASGEDLGECRAGAATVPVSAAKCTGTYTCCSPGNSCITLTHAVDCAGADPSTT